MRRFGSRKRDFIPGFGHFYYIQTNEANYSRRDILRFRMDEILSAAYHALTVSAIALPPVMYFLDYL